MFKVWFIRGLVVQKSPGLKVSRIIVSVNAKFFFLLRLQRTEVCFLEILQTILGHHMQATTHLLHYIQSIDHRNDGKEAALDLGQ